MHKNCDQTSLLLIHPIIPNNNDTVMILHERQYRSTQQQYATSKYCKNSMLHLKLERTELIQRFHFAHKRPIKFHKHRIHCTFINNCSFVIKTRSSLYTLYIGVYHSPMIHTFIFIHTIKTAYPHNT